MERAKRMWESYLELWKRLTGRKRALFYLFHYTLLFLIAFLLAYSPFLLKGNSFIWTSDGRNQHYPTLVYIGRYLRQLVSNFLHGEFAVPLFDPNIGVGADVISTLNYYGFGDPLYFLSIFAPTRYIECLYNFLTIFRMYLAGLAFSALCIYHKKRASFTMIGALMYVFSGYAIFSAVRHPYFISPMIQFPLLLFGVDRIIGRKKPFQFIAAVFYSTLCGFYFLYMMTILTGIYTLIRFFDYYLVDRIKEFARMAGRIIGAYALGIGMAAVLFLPSVIGYLSSSRAGEVIERNYFSYGWTTYRNNLLRFIAPPASWNILSLAAIALPTVVLLFSTRRKRRTLKLLVASGMCIYLLPLGGYIMNGFSYPINRWTFGLALLFSYIVVEMLPSLLNLTPKQKWICVGAHLAYMGCVFISSGTRGVYYVVGVSMLGTTLIVLLLVNEGTLTRRKMGYLGVAACAMLMIGNVSINAIYKFGAAQGNYVSEFTKYGTETKRLESALIREAEPYLEQELGRFDSSSSPRNLGMVWRVPTLSSYWSITNSNVTDFWTKLENTQQGHNYNIYGTDQRTIMGALLSARYFISEKDSAQYVPYGYTLLEKTEGGKAVYENQYALPWGYTYDSCTSYGVLEGLSALELEEAMLQTIALDENIKAVPIGSVEINSEAVPYEIKSMSKVEWEDGILTVTGTNAVMTLEFQLPKQVEGYLRLQGFDINGSGQNYFTVTVECDGVSKDALAKSTLNNWYFGRENYLFNLGYSEVERTVCTITFPAKGTFRLDDIQLYALPMDKYPQQVEALRAEPLENIEFGTNQITGTVELSKDKTLCLSIPYSKGWSAKVDGQKVKILRGNYMFMALPLTAGRHDIELKYWPPGLTAGLALSGISIAGVIGLALYTKKKRREDTAEE